jgi:antitoxin (DNA-binding transcriptional repressor) of toxin-antitoxin stability system
MKHVALSDAQSQLDQLVAEIESTGDDVVITRDGVAVARLVREAAPDLAELTPEQIERRRQAIARIRANARSLGIATTHEEIKEWINEGRR